LPVIYENSDRFNTREGFTQYQNKDTLAIGQINVKDKTYAGTPVTSIKSRNPPVRGDHKGNFPYSANGFEMIQDIPRSVHYTSTAQGVVPNTGGEGRFNFVSEDTVQKSWLSCQEQVWTFNGRFPDVELPNLTAESETGALNDLAENQISLGASIAEGRQTIDMFAGLVSQFARAAYQAKRGNFSAIPNILGMSSRDILTGKFAANKWLEYQYGWKPLMSDIADSQQKVHEVLLKDYILIGSKSTSAENVDSSDGSTGRRVLKSKISVKTQIKAKISNPALHSISSWGLINPVSIAWELVPFSFVVDWFMPVGNTLNAASAGVGLTFLGGSRMTKYLAEYAWTGSSLSGAGATVISPGLVVGKTYDVQRDIYHEFPRAKFYADTTPFSTPRVGNAAALLRQLR